MMVPSSPPAVRWNSQCLAVAVLALVLALSVLAPTVGLSSDGTSSVYEAVVPLSSIRSATGERSVSGSQDVVHANLGLSQALGSILGQSGATLSVSPPSIGPGGIVTATWTGVTPSGSDWIALYPAGSTGSYLSWRYTSGTAGGSVPFQLPATLAPGTYELRLFAGYTLLATSNQFTLPSLTASPPSVAPGGIVTVAWSGISNASIQDWIGLYPVGVADTDLRYSFIFTGGAASGQAGYQLPSDLAAGTYELRLFSNGTWLRLAVSNRFTLPSLAISGPAFSPGALLTVSWNGITSPTNTDWIGLFPTTALDDASQRKHWQYTNGAASGVSGFRLPDDLPDGSYNLRLFSNGSWLRLAVSGPLQSLNSPGTQAEGCSPRPPVLIQFTPETGHVHLAPGAGDIEAIEFGATTNAWLGPGLTGPSTWTLRVNYFDLYLSAQGPGPSMVPFVVVDGCGRWPTFVGTGTLSTPLPIATSTPLPTSTPTPLPTNTPQPPATPIPSLGFSPVVVIAGSTVTASWNNVANPSASDTLSVIGQNGAVATSTPATGQSPGSKSITIPDSLSSGSYRLRYTRSNGTIAAETQNTFSVVRTTLSASPGSIVQGATITAQWSNIPNQSTSDSVMLYLVGGSDPRGIVSVSSSTATSAQLTTAVRIDPGTYELRYYSASRGTTIATSNPVTINLAVPGAQENDVWSWAFAMTESSVWSGYNFRGSQALLSSDLPIISSGFTSALVATTRWNISPGPKFIEAGIVRSDRYPDSTGFLPMRPYSTWVYPGIFIREAVDTSVPLLPDQIYRFRNQQLNFANLDFWETHWCTGADETSCHRLASNVDLSPGRQPAFFLPMLFAGSALERSCSPCSLGYTQTQFNAFCCPDGYGFWKPFCYTPPARIQMRPGPVTVQYSLCDASNTSWLIQSDPFQYL
jgi:hypothetical protein